ncbi:MAG: HRDC domain-containing protein, partial [Actinomycetota bacterium]
RDVPAYVVFTDRTLDDLIERRPASIAELEACHGIGPAKLADFGAELLAAVADAQGHDPPSVEPVSGPASDRPADGPTPPGSAPDGLADTLRGWRLERARARDVPAYRIFNDRTLDELCARLPASDEELLDCPGIGPAKLEAFGDDLLAVIADAVAAQG